MPVIRRDDGIQFAIQTYRELLNAKSASLLKSEIRLLSQSHGEYLRLFKSAKNKIEAVFSRDPGFLLGESIWYYFGRPADLIYCEALPDSQQALVIVVKSSTIYLDTKIPYASIADEFATLLSGQNKYDIHIYGNVPISNRPEAGKFVFGPAQIAAFHRLERSLLNELALDEELELQPLELALRSDIFRRATQVRYVIYAVIALFLLIFGYYQFISTEKVIPEVRPLVRVEPESGYEMALMTPSPAGILHELSQSVGLMSTAPGWAPVRLRFSSGAYTYEFINQGGTLTILRRWAIHQNLEIDFASDGIKVTMPSNVKPRPRPEEIFLNQAALTMVIDMIDRVLGNKSVNIESYGTLSGGFKTTAIVINVASLSPGMIGLLGRALTNMPLRLDSLQFAIADGQMSGTINLTVIGK